MALPALMVEVELSISASNLEDRDATSKSDPLCVVYLKVIDLLTDLVIYLVILVSET